MNQALNTSSSEMKKCFDLLEEGEKIIRTDQKDAILVVGNTGSGKTTLVQFLAGDNNDLYTEEASPGSGDFIICLLYTSPSPRDRTRSRMPSSA